MEIPLPAPKVVKDLLDDLLGRPVSVNIGDPMVAEALATAAVSIYVDDQMTARAVIVADLALAANAGAALGLIPPGGAEGAIEDEELSPMMAENLAEIFNVLGGLVNHEGCPHLRLQNSLMPGEPIPSDIRAIVLSFGRRLDLDIEVSGYGGGHFSVALV